VCCRGAVVQAKGALLASASTASPGAHIGFSVTCGASLACIRRVASPRASRLSPLAWNSSNTVIGSKVDGTATLTCAAAPAGQSCCSHVYDWPGGHSPYLMQNSAAVDSIHGSRTAQAGSDGKPATNKLGQANW
jgi:hypothetical protein